MGYEDIANRDMRFTTRTDLRRHFSDIINPDDYRCGEDILERICDKVRDAGELEWDRWYSDSEFVEIVRKVLNGMEFYAYLDTLDDPDPEAVQALKDIGRTEVFLNTREIFSGNSIKDLVEE